MTRPLSWHEARSRLRDVLEQYQADVNVREKSSQPLTVDATSGRFAAQCQLWTSLILNNDIDLYVGSCGLSLCLCVIMAVHFFQSPSSSLFGDPCRTAVLSEMVGSALLFAGSMLTVFLIRRRRVSSSTGTNYSKLQEVSRFLKMMDKQTQSCHGDVTQDNVILQGTSLTDFYAVYRLKDDRRGSWSKIPTLLLTQGDHIALQIGDLAPARCRLIATSDDDTTSQRIMCRGERIAPDTMEGATQASKLPIGRTTIPEQSDQLLTLCRNMRLFVVLETPLDDFLREEQVPQKSPQVHRQLNAMRVVATGVAVCLFVCILLLIFTRLDYNDGDLVFVLPLAFLAALGLLPLMSPACLICMEILGTARILVPYHAVSCRTCEDNHDALQKPRVVLLKYLIAVLVDRLSLHAVAKMINAIIPESSLQTSNDQHDQWSRGFGDRDEFHVPSASMYIFEKLGVATAFTLIDDELACEPHAIPQQLLIPAWNGLKLLDICPAYEDDDHHPTHSTNNPHDGGDDSVSSEGKSHLTRSHRRIMSDHAADDGMDSDSDLSETFGYHHSGIGRNRNKQKQQRYKTAMRSTLQNEVAVPEVQFEEPSWWKHLPSLKCIGLACLLVDDSDPSTAVTQPTDTSTAAAPTSNHDYSHDVDKCKRALANLICKEQYNSQLDVLARCIGFSTEPSTSGPKGDISTFTEHFRIHVISNTLAKRREEMDLHERSSEESQWWGLLRPDCTSVIVEDSRSGGYQIVTVGDPQVVTRLCQEAWQGESSTVSPLGQEDRDTILGTTDDWKLGDRSVAAFSFCPVPYTFEKRCKQGEKFTHYLLDNEPGDPILPNLKDKSSTGEWPLLHNQIFLGVLGSLVVPRQDIQVLLSTFQNSGVRFVYFSPRNMRRQKEIASQMGIDVAWNCAISLRPLVDGEDDPYRMKSNYADWNVNARLPHGVESVRRHLEEVDNVPLLVSLFTDATKETTKEMVEVFQEYDDTVVTYGLSHLPRNSHIFATSDIAIGVDGLTVQVPLSAPDMLNCNAVLPAEVSFASRISALWCAFHVRGVEATAFIPSIIAQGRTALEAATSGAIFMVTASLSFSLYALFSACSVSVAIPYIPSVGAVLYLQVVVPILSLAMVMSDSDRRCMNRVPPKNDQSIAFGKREGKVLYQTILLKSVLPAVLAQLLYLIAFGELVISMDGPDGGASCADGNNWTSVIRCRDLRGYTGQARVNASVLAFGHFMLCNIASSAAFVHRLHRITDERPWQNNRAWTVGVACCFTTTVLYMVFATGDGTAGALPFYYYILCIITPPLCVAWDEMFKRMEQKYHTRDEKLRRLQFETRLGMWSPK